MKKLGYILASFMIIGLTVMIIINSIDFGYSPQEKDSLGGNEPSTQNKQQEVIFPEGSRQNPIQLDDVASRSGKYYLEPGDSVWFFCNPDLIGYHTEFVDYINGKMLVYRKFDTEPMIETPSKSIPASQMRGVDLFCIKNTGKEIVVLYAWFGHLSQQAIQKLTNS